MKKKWKLSLLCAVVLAGIAAWCLLPRPAVAEDCQVYYVAAGEKQVDVTDQVDLEAMGELLRGAERRGCRVSFAPLQLQERSVDIGVLESSRHWHLYMDEDTCVIYESADKGGYPIIDGGGLLEQVWALLPGP